MNDQTDYRIPILLAIPILYILYWTITDYGPRPEVTLQNQSPPDIEVGFQDQSAADDALRSVFRLEKIPVNSADSDLLQSIPGIGPQLAERIIAERKTSGPFASPDALRRVDGIGRKRVAQFQEHLRFD
ncbi:MAG: helix-hairpin-helix domain-containing protein [Desulfofustis sp.]|jgi:competence ComEA-like helix-hairpin-helix protein|nr:helix-hairpin-helix domain-containing protein [Desulfofustis sp.]